MKNFFNNIESVIAASKAQEEQDRADLVQTIIIIAGFAIAAIAIVGWISTALFGIGADTARCITGVQTYGGSAQTTQTNCENQTQAKQADGKITGDAAYKGRFGTSAGS